MADLDARMASNNALLAIMTTPDPYRGRDLCLDTWRIAFAPLPTGYVRRGKPSWLPALAVNVGAGWSLKPIAAGASMICTTEPRATAAIHRAAAVLTERGVASVVSTTINHAAYSEDGLAQLASVKTSHAEQRAAVHSLPPASPPTHPRDRARRRYPPHVRKVRHRVPQLRPHSTATRRHTRGTNTTREFAFLNCA